jgi:hypothetical protein
VLTADFASAVRAQAQLPDSVTDAAILDAANREVRGTMLPLLRAMRAEYGVRRMRVDVANGRARIPERAQVAGVRLVQLVDGGMLRVLRQVTPEEDYGGTGAVPVAWYFDAGTICVVPSSASGTLLVRYYQQAPDMLLSAPSTQTAAITSVTVTSTTVTIAFSGSVTLSQGDVVSADADHRTVVPGLVSGTGNASWLLSAMDGLDMDLPRVGDWVAPARKTPFVPLPEELATALVHRTSSVLLRSLGYLSEADAAMSAAAEAEGRARVLLAPRAEGNARVLTATLSARLVR